MATLWSGTLSDDTTTVLWLQTPSGVYCDVRVPIAARSPPDAVDSLAARTAQRSFAGRLTWQGDVTTWHRHLDFRPFSGTLDVGDNSFSPDGVFLTELGVHENYLEVWQRVDSGVVAGSRRFLAMELVEDAHGRAGVFVVVGSHVGVAVGRRADDPVRVSGAKSYAELWDTTALTLEQQLQVTHGYRCDVGDAGSRLSDAVVRHSTVAAREGLPLLAPGDAVAVEGGGDLVPGAVVTHATTCFETGAAVTRRWRVVEATGITGAWFA